MNNVNIYIKYLPKDILLYHLWLNAKPKKYLLLCDKNIPILTIKKANRDIKLMQMDNRRIDVTTYYGRCVYSDITDDYLDISFYDFHNGKGKGESIINELKLKELSNSVVKYYVFN